MFRVTRISSFASEGADRTRAAWTTVQRQPGWLVKATAIAFIVVLGLPLLLLLLLALVVATAIFATLFAVNFLLAAVRGALPGGGDGRENVRVIRRE